MDPELAAQYLRPLTPGLTADDTPTTTSTDWSTVLREEELAHSDDAATESTSSAGASTVGGHGGGEGFYGLGGEDVYSWNNSQSGQMEGMPELTPEPIEGEDGDEEAVHPGQRVELCGGRLISANNTASTKKRDFFKRMLKKAKKVARKLFHKE